MKGRLIIGICLITVIGFAGDIVTERHELPYKGEEELSVGIEFGLGKLELRSTDNKKYIMQAEITYSKDLYKPEVDYKTVGNRGKLRLASRQNESSGFWGHSKKSSSSDIKKNHWRVAMTDQIPTAYDIELGLGKGILDFTNIKVNDLNLECGLSDVLVEFTKSNKERIRTLVIQSGLGNVEATGLCNANMDRFEVECGLGSTKLRFDGDLNRDIKGRITIGLGSVAVQISEDYAVQIEAESSFLSSLNFDGFREVEENIYRSKNWKNADRRIYIVVEIGLGSVDIEWIE
ncbi:hypothetical protein KJ762_08460 [bacterium]|nr:hypothetical protein [bacterium]MBU1634525.1 hypothetical protein [bacterium]